MMHVSPNTPVAQPNFGRLNADETKELKQIIAEQSKWGNEAAGALNTDVSFVTKAPKNPMSPLKRLMWAPFVLLDGAKLLLNRKELSQEGSFWAQWIKVARPEDRAELAKGTPSENLDILTTQDSVILLHRGTEA